jgi:hypothetical protein
MTLTSEDVKRRKYFKGATRRKLTKLSQSLLLEKNMRTECIDQLRKIGDLFEKGCISEHHLQDAIMKDIN